MTTIGFIGASGLMGHGMAKNLQAKGHPLAITAFRKRERVADLLAAGAKECPARPRWRASAAWCSCASPARRRSSRWSPAPTACCRARPRG